MPREVCIIMSQDIFCEGNDTSRMNTIDKIVDEDEHNEDVNEDSKIIRFIDDISRVDIINDIVEITNAPSKGESVKYGEECS